ncbi:MAG: GC-type dockerin domain-anchored protein [Phycisphaerales bacterium JB052]
MPNFHWYLLGLLMSIVTSVSGQVLDSRLDDVSPQNEAKFGFDFVMDGEWLAVGASFWDTDELQDLGSVLLYKRIDDQWAFQKRLMLETPFIESGSQFGKGLSMHNGMLAVGQPNAQGVIDRMAGKVSVYGIDVGGHENWGLIDVLRSPNEQRLARMGFATQLIDNMLFIGEYGHDSTGRVLVYQYDQNDGWALQDEITPPPNERIIPHAFGWSLSVDRYPNGTYQLMVGAPNSDYYPSGCTPPACAPESQAGVIYFFAHNGDGWFFQNEVTNIGTLEDMPDFGLTGARLGHVVDLGLRTGNAVAGAPSQFSYSCNDDACFGVARGQVLLFEYDQVADTWSVAERFAPYGPADSEGDYGAGVSLQGDELVVTTRKQSKVHFYARHAGGGFGQWGAYEVLDLSAETSGDVLSKVQYQADQILIGASNNDFDAYSNAGSLFELDAQISACRYDLNRDRVLSFVDISIFIEAYNAADSSADLNDDETVNFYDIAEFVQGYLQGC